MPRYYTPVVNGSVVAAVRIAFQRSRTSPRNWLTRQHAGRLDQRNVWRNEARGDKDIFRERLAPGASKVNVHILVDGSSSMTVHDSPEDKLRDQSRIKHAADITATLCDAFRTQPTVRFNVWFHNSNGDDRNSLNVYPVVTNGKGRESIGKMVDHVASGNGDGYILRWIGEKLRREHRHNEIDLVIVVSDGLPSWVANSYGEGAFAFGAKYENDPETLALGRNAVALMYNEVEKLRDMGIQVLSVAICPNSNQAEMFGESNVIPFDGKDWNKLAVSFGSALGRTLHDAAEAKSKGHRR